MFALGIRYLCGWAMATHQSDRQEAEWPPHPDRVFMALAAAHFETDGGPEEYEALRRLSALGPPALSASGSSPRQTVTTFVPVNDDASPISKKGRPMMPSGSLAIGRDRQPRSFPVAIPERDKVFLIWRDKEVSATDRQALDRLCRKVTCIGHSASLVQMWVTGDTPEPNLVPCELFGGDRRSPSGNEGRARLRVAETGRLVALEESYRNGLRPSAARSFLYERTSPTPHEPDIPGTVFDPALIVLYRVEGQPLGLESTLLLTEALRGAILSCGPQPPPDWISGHEGLGGPPLRSQEGETHLALMPLAHVGHEHADGRLLGVALAVPKNNLPADKLRRGLSGFLFQDDGIEPAVRILFKGRSFEWRVALDDRESSPLALRPETWTSGPPRRPSARWGSVTPVVLDRYPKGGNDAERMAQTEAMIRQACTRVGLPEPSSVVTTPAPPFVGVPHARGFPPLLKGPAGGKRYHTHVVMDFPAPVRGPILLGAGRFRGYGLLRPLGGEDR